MTNNLGGTYSTGTISIAADGTVFTGTGTLWSTQAEQGDWIFANGNIAVITSDAITDTTLTSELPWTGGVLSGASYVLLKMSWLRYESAITQQKVREFITNLTAAGLFTFVSGAAPDPGMGVEGQWALKVNSGSWKIWYYTGGVWVLQGTPAGIDIIGTYDAGHTYADRDGVYRNGSLYLSLVDANLGNTPESSPTDWQIVVSKGDTGAILLLPIAAWSTGVAYVVGPPASYVSQAGSSYQCLVAHTSGTFATDLAAGKWGIVASKGTDGTNGSNGANGAGYGGSSTTSLAIATGSKTFTGVATTLAYQVSNYVRASSAANGANFMEGYVTAYSGGSLTLNVTKIGGSGTLADWNFAIAGAPGTGDMLSSNYASEYVGHEAAVRANLGIPGDNLIVNSGFRVNQMGYVSGATLAAGVYGHDQWKAGASGGDYSFTQLKSSTQITIASGKSLIQPIEDVNVAGGSYVLSWTGTAQARAGINTLTPSGSYASSPILITGQTAATAMSVEFNAGTLGTVKLESGASVTPYVMRKLQDELLLCRRYFLQVQSSNVNTIMMNGVAVNTTRMIGAYVFPTEMSKPPTFSVVNPTHFSVADGAGSIVANTALGTSANTGTMSMGITADVASGLTAGRGSYLITTNVDAALRFDARL